MRKALLYLVVKLCIITLLISCGPSAEEKAAMEKNAKEDPGIELRVKVRFSSGAVDTLKITKRGTLKLDSGDLVDDPGSCCNNVTLAKHVDAFTAIE